MRRQTTQAQATADPFRPPIDFSLDGPQIEELDVPPAAVRRSVDRRPLLALAVVGAIVGYGFIGTLGGGATRGGRAPAPTPAPTPPVSAAPTRTLPRATFHLPVIGTTVWSSDVPVLADVPPDVRDVVVEGRLGSLVVGRVAVRPRNGRIDTILRVLSPGAGVAVPVDVVLHDGAERELARTSVRVVEPAAATVEATVVHLPSGEAQLQLAGTARLSHAPLAIATARGGTVRTTVVKVRPIRREPLVHAGGVLGVGRWLATAMLPSGSDPIVVEVRGADGALLGSLRLEPEDEPVEPGVP